MDKAVYGGSISIALVLIAGSYFIPNDSMMWLASTSLVMNLARLIIIGLMLALIFTNPPRRRELRLALAVAAMAFVGVAVVRIMSGTVQVVDALLFLSASVSFGIAAIEAPATYPYTPRVVPENAFAKLIESASERAGLMTFRQRVALNLLAVRLLYRMGGTKPRVLNLIERHANGHGRIANAHSP